MELDQERKTTCFSDGMLCFYFLSSSTTTTSTISYFDIIQSLGYYIIEIYVVPASELLRFSVFISFFMNIKSMSVGLTPSPRPLGKDNKSLAVNLKSSIHHYSQASQNLVVGVHNVGQ